MATTKIKVIHTDLHRRILYALNPRKTLSSEFRTALNCGPETENAYDDMLRTKARWKKESPDEVLGYHIILNFKPGEVTPKEAHAAGVEFTRRYLGDKFEAIIGTHQDKEHLHCHIVFNSVSFVDGKMYRDDFDSYFNGIRGTADEVCRERELSVIEHPGHSGKHYAEWKAEQEDKPTWRGLVRKDIDGAIQGSMTYGQFLEALKQKGYEIKLHVKYPAVKPPGAERFIRLKSLGVNYTPEAIQQRILYQKRPKRTAPRNYSMIRHARYAGRFLFRPPRTLSGFVGLWIRYLMLLRREQTLFHDGIRLPLAADLRKLEDICGQARLLSRNRIHTTAQLAAYQGGVQKEMDALTEERKELHNAKRRQLPPGEMEKLKRRSTSITARMKELRTESRYCDQIAEQAAPVHVKVQWAVKQESQERKERSHERSSGADRQHGNKSR